MKPSRPAPLGNTKLFVHKHARKHTKNVEEVLTTLSILFECKGETESAGVNNIKQHNDCLIQLGHFS